MEEFFRSGPFDTPAKVKESHVTVKKDDVELIVRLQFLCLTPDMYLTAHRSVN